MTMNTTFDTHEKKGKRLNVGNKVLEGALTTLGEQLCTIQILLTLALLLEKVTTAVAIESEFSASCTIDTLLRTAVRLNFRHKDDGV
jgi:hypothetical protein